MNMNFFTDSNVSQFWGYVKMILQGVSPGVMIWFSLIAVGFVLPIVVKAFRKSDQEEEDEIEVRHY